MNDRWFVVAENAAAYADAVASLERRGFRVCRGWEPPKEPWDLSGRRVACVGRILGRDDRVAAVEAAARGASLVIAGPVDELAPLVEDLRRLGEVEHRRSSGLDRQQRRLLELLGDGLSLGEAAERLFISRRTADRRLAAARRALGARTTAEAIVAASESEAPR